MPKDFPEISFNTVPKLSAAGATRIISIRGATHFESPVSRMATNEAGCPVVKRVPAMAYIRVSSVT